MAIPASQGCFRPKAVVALGIASSTEFLLRVAVDGTEWRKRTGPAQRHAREAFKIYLCGRSSQKLLQLG